MKAPKTIKQEWTLKNKLNGDEFKVTIELEIEFKADGSNLNCRLAKVNQEKLEGLLKSLVSAKDSKDIEIYIDLHGNMK
jgi:hypothetical protein